MAIMFGMLGRADGAEFNSEVPLLKDASPKLMLCIEESRDGVVEKIYFYYVNAEGKRVLHGKMVEYKPGRVREESVYEDGRFVEKSSTVVYER